MAKGQKVDELYISLGLDINQLNLDFETAGKTVSQTISRLNSQNNRIKLQTDIDLSKLEGTGSELDKMRVKYAAINQQLDIQRQKQEVLNAVARDARNQYGADSGLTRRADTNAMYQQRNIAAMEAEMRKLKIQMDAAGASAAGFGAKMSAGLLAARNGISSLSSGYSLLSGKMAAVMAVATTGAGIFSITDGAMQAGENIYRLSNRLHTTAAEASSLNRVFQFAGVDINQVVPMFARLDKQVENAGIHGNTTTQALQKFGVSLTDQSGSLLPLTEQLKNLAAGYIEARNGGKELDFTTNVLGARGAALIPVLEQYQELMEINSHVKTTGLLDPQQAHEVYIQWSAMKIEAGQLTNALGSALLPVAEELMPEITEGMGEFITLIRDNKDDIKKAVEGWGSALAGVAKVIGAIGIAVGKYSANRIDQDWLMKNHPIAGIIQAHPSIPFLGTLANEYIYGDEYKQYQQQQQALKDDDAKDMAKRRSINSSVKQIDKDVAKNNTTQTKNDAAIDQQVADIQYHAAHTRLENEMYDIDQKAKKSIAAGTSEAEAWKLAEAEKAEASRKFQEEIAKETEAIQNEIYGMTHTAYDTKLHNVGVREKDMRSKNIDEGTIAQYDAAARAKIEDDRQNALQGMYDVGDSAYQKQMSQIEHQKKSWLDAGATNAEAEKAAQSQKTKYLTDLNEQYTEKLKSFTQSELQNKLDAIEKEKKAWIDKGLSEVNATKLSEQEKADAIANTNRSVLTSQREAYEAYRRGGEGGLKSYIKEKDNYDGSIDRSRISDFQQAQKDIIRELYGETQYNKIIEPAQQTADNTKGILQFLTGKPDEAVQQGGTEKNPDGSVTWRLGNAKIIDMQGNTGWMDGMQNVFNNREQYAKLSQAPQGRYTSSQIDSMNQNGGRPVTIQVSIGTAVTPNSEAMRQLADTVADTMRPTIEQVLGGDSNSY